MYQGETGADFELRRGASPVVLNDIDPSLGLDTDLPLADPDQLTSEEIAEIFLANYGSRPADLTPDEEVQVDRMVDQGRSNYGEAIKLVRSQRN